MQKGEVADPRALEVKCRQRCSSERTEISGGENRANEGLQWQVREGLNVAHCRVAQGQRSHWQAAQRREVRDFAVVDDQLLDRQAAQRGKVARIRAREVEFLERAYLRQRCEVRDFGAI